MPWSTKFDLPTKLIKMRAFMFLVSRVLLLTGYILLKKINEV